MLSSIWKRFDWGNFFKCKFILIWLQDIEKGTSVSGNFKQMKFKGTDFYSS